MRKGLIGIVVLAFVALICGTAFAAQSFQSINVDASLEWTIFDETGIIDIKRYITDSFFVSRG